jgi:hypothetical protein
LRLDRVLAFCLETKPWLTHLLALSIDMKPGGHLGSEERLCRQLGLCLDLKVGRGLNSILRKKLGLCPD